MKFSFQLAMEKGEICEGEKIELAIFTKTTNTDC